ncbi:unnamed protein product [Ectocarpus sp. CCAP 1310/34]|nr:unnamed protein product [Ectocarpus sp. CCAP 1310/34]
MTRIPGGRAIVVALLACLASVVCAASVYPSDPHLDWSEWDDPPASHLNNDPAKSIMDSNGRQHVDEAGVRRLVTTCALRLELSADVCGKGEVPDPQDAYRLHHMHSGGLPCGFEERLGKEAMEDIASKYSFHFIGDSTSRRLGESFVSIFTGRGSTHPVVQRDINFSSGNLKVHFYWAPLCSGPESVGAMLTTVMDAVLAAKDGKRAVIITAFGVHDAFELQHAANGHGSPSYQSTLPQDIVEKDGMRAAALGACRDATTQLVRTAAATAVPGTAAPPVEEEQSPGDAQHQLPNVSTQVGRHETSQKQAAGIPPNNVRGGSVGAGKEDALDASAPPAASGPLQPLLFLMQNNRYPPGSVENAFQEDLHRIQRQAVGEWEASEGSKGDDGERGLFLVDDSVGLYGNLSCYRSANPIHFDEPVKLMEGKMLWDLLVLVDNGSVLPPTLLLANEDYGDSADGEGGGRFSINPLSLSLSLSLPLLVFLLIPLACFLFRYCRNRETLARECQKHGRNPSECYI